MKFAHKLTPCPAGGAGSCAFAVQHGADRAAVPAGAAHRAGNVICRLAAGKPRHAAHLGHTRQRQPGRTGGQLFAGHHRAEQPCLRRLQCGWNLPVLCPAHRGSLYPKWKPCLPRMASRAWCWRTTIPCCAPERSFCRNAASPWSLRRMPPPCGRRGRPAPEMH